MRRCSTDHRSSQAACERSRSVAPRVPWTEYLRDIHPLPHQYTWWKSRASLFKNAELMDRRLPLTPGCKAVSMLRCIVCALGEAVPSICNPEPALGRRLGVNWRGHKNGTLGTTMGVSDYWFSTS
jgi:hypothetical protein